ncbi:MAG: hypothetical protein ACFB0C_06675 [Leptolyngbyaceae cyanobacterium]
MNIDYLRHAAVTGAKFSALGLLAIGCNAKQSIPETDLSSTASTAETTATETVEAKTPADQGDTAAPSQAAQPQGEPGYVGYPLMGETADGEPIYYISSELIDCPDAGCVLINFLQVDAVDANQTAEGQAVGNCTQETLSEVILDGDLVAYEIASPDAAMAELLNTACQANRPGEFTPSVPSGLVEGMPYGEARSRLLETGWVPRNAPLDHYTGLEQDMYDRGYTEVQGCSGTGLCRFEFVFQAPNALASNEALIVVTSFADSDTFFEEDPRFGSANIGPTY